MSKTVDTQGAPNSVLEGVSRKMKTNMEAQLVEGMNREPWTARGIVATVAGSALIASLVGLVLFAEVRARSACEGAGYSLSGTGHSFACVDTRGVLHQVP